MCFEMGDFFFIHFHGFVSIYLCLAKHLMLTIVFCSHSFIQYETNAHWAIISKSALIQECFSLPGLYVFGGCAACSFLHGHGTAQSGPPSQILLPKTRYAALPQKDCGSSLVHNVYDFIRLMTLAFLLLQGYCVCGESDRCQSREQDPSSSKRQISPLSTARLQTGTQNADPAGQNKSLQSAVKRRQPLK